MNRVRKTSRRYEAARPDIEEMRAKRRLARRLVRMLRDDSPMAELRKIATLLAIKGRSKMNREELLEAIHGRSR